MSQSCGIIVRGHEVQSTLRTKHLSCEGYIAFPWQPWLLCQRLTRHEPVLVSPRAATIALNPAGSTTSYFDHTQDPVSADVGSRRQYASDVSTGKRLLCNRCNASLPPCSTLFDNTPHHETRMSTCHLAGWCVLEDSLQRLCSCAHLWHHCTANARMHTPCVQHVGSARSQAP